MAERNKSSLFCGKRLLAALLVILVLAAFQQPAVKDWVHWQGQDQLSFSDFRKKNPGRPVKYKTGKRSFRMLEGFIESGISFGYSSVNGRAEAFEVYAYMVPAASWLADTMNTATLEHEQAHFNITEIYARQLRRKLQINMKVDQARRHYQQTMQELKVRQQLFDHDHKSENGVNEKWKKLIREELQALEPWASNRP